MNLFQSLIGFLGRLCISVIFITIGVRMLLDWQSSEHYYVANLCDWLSLSEGNEALRNAVEMAMNHSFLVLSGSIFCVIGGGLLVALGLSVRLGAFLLLIVLIPATGLFHHFWSLQGIERDVQLSNFMRNISIIGGLFILLSVGRGGQTSKRKEKKNED